MYPYLLFFLLTLWSGEKVTHSDAEWRKKLGTERYLIMREKGTERPFLGKYILPAQKGTYLCAACALPLFDAKDQFRSLSGYPSFTKPISPKNIYYLEDFQMPFKRYEVLCRRCDSHLGHIFNDRPQNGLRYCINSLSLLLESEH